MRLKSFALRCRGYAAKIGHILGSPQMKLLPGHLAFFTILSIIPVYLILNLALGSFGLPAGYILEYIGLYLPEAVSEILAAATLESIALPAVAWIATAPVFASNGLHAVIVSSDTLYGFGYRNYWIMRAKALILTLLLTTAAVALIVLITVMEYFFASGLPALIFGLLKWPTEVFFIFLAARTLYMITPRKLIPARLTGRGALFTTAGWITASIGYSLYVRYYGNYGTLYGGLSNVIVLIMWVYIMSYVFIIGMAINSHIYQLANGNSPVK